MPSFHKAWARQDTAGMTDKVRDTLKPQGALPASASVIGERDDDTGEVANF